MRGVTGFGPHYFCGATDLSRKSAGIRGPKIAAGLGRMDDADRSNDLVDDFPPEADEPDQRLPLSPGARGFEGRRYVRRREAAPPYAALVPAVQAVLTRYAALARVRLPRRAPGWHVASFIGGIVVGLIAAQFVGSGESAALPSAARMPSVQSPAPVPSSAALPSPTEVPPPTSADKAIESGAAPKISRIAETRRPVAATKYQGGLRIDSRPAGAAVFVNNQEIGHTPIVLSSLQAGSRAVRIQLGGYAPWSRSVRVVANEHATVLAVLEPSR